MPATRDAVPVAQKDGGRFEPAILDFGDIENRIEKSLVRKVRKLVDDYPERALEVIRAWMAEGDSRRPA